jgi:hypothetical protein
VADSYQIELVEQDYMGSHPKAQSYGGSEACVDLPTRSGFRRGDLVEKST